MQQSLKTFNPGNGTETLQKEDSDRVEVALKTFNPGNGTETWLEMITKGGKENIAQNL